MKIAYIDNGLHSYSTFNPMGSDFIPLSMWDIKNCNLCRYDVLIIPFHTDQMALTSYEKKLERFLNNGGILILLGVMANRSQWIPYCEWRGSEKDLKEAKILRSGSGAVFFENIDNDEIYKLHAHGLLHYPFGENIISFNNEEKIFVVDTNNFIGNFLITTIDPDHHIIRDMTAMSKGIHEISNKLLLNIINWSKDIHSQKKGFRWAFIRNKAIVKEFFHSNLFKNLSITISIVTLLLMLSYFHNIYFTAMAGIASIIGLQMSFIKNR